MVDSVMRTGESVFVYDVALSSMIQLLSLICWRRYSIPPRSPVQPFRGHFLGHDGGDTYNDSVVKGEEDKTMTRQPLFFVATNE